MADQEAIVSIEVQGGPSISVPWDEGMNARRALELAYENQEQGHRFTYGLQFYGTDLGYLVMMINENYDSFNVGYEPDFYWEMLVNGAPSGAGVDQTVVAAGDVVGFRYEMRRDGDAGAPMSHVKHERRI